jgi:replicative DNA helicase
MSAAEARLDRPLPQSLDAERAVLGAILIEPKSFFRVQSLLSPASFSRDSHRTIYRAMVRMVADGDSIEFLTLKELLSTAGLLEKVGGTAYISSLVDVVPDVANIETYAGYVARAEKLRTLISAGNAMVQRAMIGEDEPEVIAADAMVSLTPAASSEDTQARPFGQIITETFREAERRFSKGEEISLRTSFGNLNSYAALNRTLVIGASPSNHGKTAWGINMAADIAKHEQPTALFTLESRNEELVWRHAAAVSGVPHSRVRDWQRIVEGDGTDMRKLIEVERAAKHLPLFVTRRIRTIDAIYAECRRLKATVGLSAALIDYVQLIGFPGGPRDREERFAVISQRLLEMALDLDICVIGLSQLNKDRMKRDSGRLHQNDLKYASAIAESARVVLMFQRPHADAKADPDLRPCYVMAQLEKNNEGRTGDFEMHFSEVTQKFSDGNCEENNCRFAVKEKADERMFR